MSAATCILIAMFWFVVSVIGFVLFLVMAILASTAPPSEPPNPTDYSVWEYVTGDAMKKMEAKADAVEMDQKMKVWLWIITVGLLAASVATGVNAFG